MSDASNWTFVIAAHAVTWLTLGGYLALLFARRRRALEELRGSHE
jgi:CcmD family protein